MPAAMTLAHALHPNYPEKHDPALQPTLGGGMVIKTNLEQRYATSAVSGTIGSDDRLVDKQPCQ